MGGLRWTVGDRRDIDDRRFDPPPVRPIADGVDGDRRKEPMSTQLVIFPDPPDAAVTLRHDNGITTASLTGEADGRPAQLIPLDETQYVEGHGAWVDLKWSDGVTLSQHGALRFQTRTDGRAAFEVDVFPKPDSF